MKELRERWKSSTPSLFKKIIKIGMAAGGVGLAIIASPIALPLYITAVAPHLITAGIIASGVSKITVDNKKEEESLKETNPSNPEV